VRDAILAAGVTAKAEPTMRINYAIIYVSDMDRSVAFYRDALGLPLRFQTPEWTEFLTEGALLALHKADHPATADGSANRAGQCQPGFAVPDLDAFHDRAIANDVRCHRAPRQEFGARLASYIDPDGLVFAVSEQSRG